MGSGLLFSSESGEEFESKSTTGYGGEEPNQLANSVTNKSTLDGILPPFSSSSSSVKVQQSTTKKSSSGKNKQKQLSSSISSSSSTSSNKKSSRNKRGGKNRKKGDSDNKGFSISIDSISACTPVTPILLPTTTTIATTTKRNQSQKKKSGRLSKLDQKQRQQQQQQIAKLPDEKKLPKLEDLFPPYDDNFTFDLFDSSIDDLLLIYSPSLLSLTEQSLEENAKEIEILESQLQKTTQEISSCASHLHTLKQNSLSTSISF